MQSLIGHKKTQVTESLIKESLLRQLSYSVKEIQLQYSQTNEVFTTNETCNSLIVVLEAIFLHGLKKGILRTALKSVGGAEETRPQPSFWTMVSSYTHNDTKNRIKKLSQINSDVGRCRVWLRMALNAAEITSYFLAMEKENRPLNRSYYNYAFLRDRETCDTACKLLEGIVSVQFDIPVNANILNTWSTEPLMLSGTWSPPLKIPLSHAVDVAECLNVEIEDDASSIRTSSSVTTLSTMLALDENQAIKIILDTPLKKSEKDLSNIAPSQVSESHSEGLTVNVDKGEENSFCDVKPTIENSLSDEQSSLSQDSEASKVVEGTKEKNEVCNEEVIAKSEEPKTFSGLLESYGHSPRDEKNYKNILEQISERTSVEITEHSSDSEFCQVPSSNFEEQLFKIAREKSLKAQNYACRNCQLSIGLNFDEARFCYFTGKYYCKNCHLNEINVIPSRLIYNWDHKKYPVSVSANSYLNEISNKYLLDIKKINPKLYSVVPEMQELRTIRFRLYLLKAYLYTCREPIILELQKKVMPKNYLYESIHLYTLNDLSRASGGALATELNGVITFARSHVFSCSLCSGKGFICEVCRNPNVIYPFDSGTTYRCRKCYSVYHEGCLSSSKNCPKCKRLKERKLPSTGTGSDNDNDDDDDDDDSE